MAQCETANSSEQILEEIADGESASYSGTFSISYPGTLQTGGNGAANQRKPTFRRKPVRILEFMEDLRSKNVQDSIKQIDCVKENNKYKDYDNTEPFESMPVSETIPAVNIISATKSNHQTPAKSNMKSKSPSPYPLAGLPTPIKSSVDPLSQGMGWLMESGRKARHMLLKAEQKHCDMHKKSDIAGKSNRTPAKVIHSTPQHGTFSATVNKGKSNSALSTKPQLPIFPKGASVPNTRGYSHCSNPSTLEHFSKVSVSKNKNPQLEKSTALTHLSELAASNSRNVALQTLNAREDNIHHWAHLPPFKGQQESHHRPCHSCLLENKENEVHYTMIQNANIHTPEPLDSHIVNSQDMDMKEAKPYNNYSNLNSVEESTLRPLHVQQDVISDTFHSPSNSDFPVTSAVMNEQLLNLTSMSQHQHRQIQVKTELHSENVDPEAVYSPAIYCEISNKDQDNTVLPMVDSPEIFSIDPQPLNLTLTSERSSQMYRPDPPAIPMPNVFYGSQNQAKEPETVTLPLVNGSCRMVSEVHRPSAVPLPAKAEMPPPLLPIKSEQNLKLHKHGNEGFGMPFRNSNPLIVNGKQYTILSQLGKGGSSVVYQAMNHATRTTVAVKIVKLAGVDANSAQGYLEEIEILKKLQKCDSVIRLLDHQLKTNHTLTVVMEKGDVDFANFLKDISKTKKVSTLLICYYWSEMVNAVKGIHENGIIHSDLKPANFLLVSGRLKLIDFGIASTLNNDMTSIIKDSIVGTFNYMSPEAVGAGTGKSNCKKISYKSDVWSLGCILYNLVYGHTPFAEIVNSWAKLMCINDPNHTIIFPAAADCPGVLMLTMKCCLKYDPRERPSTSELLKHPYLLEFKDPLNSV